MHWHARQRWLAAASAAAIVTMVAFCVFLSVAAALYPGGNAFVDDDRGFDLWRNFWTDLMRPVALGGQPNVVGSRLAIAGALAFAASLLLFWWAAPDAFRARTWLRRCVRVLAVLTAATLVGVPPGLLGVPHEPAIFLAAIFGGGASCATLVGFAGAPDLPRVIVALGAAALASTLIGLGLFARDVMAGEPLSIATPVMQKVATVFIVAWVLSGCAHQLRTSRARLCEARSR